MNSYNNIELTQDIRELSALLKSKYNDELAEDKIEIIDNYINSTNKNKEMENID